ncbi:hypothetical protein BAMA_14280 [Bacillus manliponensis]|uniref:Uncharacterized protein n=1 Tax=Bacillus manliponensis TaxID=574376 RepID=A0A073KE50_9BACI|nr:DUF3921 family protein [Bacillus manliponensis]KEK20578.1 hypothetical protein BAMA_14280 [Bacillus manliponensis]
MDGSQFAMIQKAIHRTSDELEKEMINQGIAAEGIERAQDEYLSALSYDTLIDKRYLQSLIR